MYKENKDDALKTAEQIIKNTYRTLMSRGQKSCYVYCVDERLGDYLRERLNRFYKPIEYGHTVQVRDKAAEGEPECKQDNY